MEFVVFIPGIMGSELVSPNGEKVWPPSPLEVITGYRRTDKLVSAGLVPGDVIRSVCIEVYAPLIKALEAAGYRTSGQRRLHRHPYDWRRDLSALSDELGTELAGLVAQHGAATEIKLVCHSMGGLVARGCLEQARQNAPAWLDAVKLCVFLATPHDGAPLAFARAIGVGGASLGLSEKQLRQVSAATGFPAGYQLFPPRDLTPIWTLDEEDTPFRGVSLFAPEVNATYGLNTSHMAAAEAFRLRLDPSRRPSGCRYFSVVSASHETVTRFDQADGAADAVKVAASGDGTVPVTSAAALRIQTAYVHANHVGVSQKATSHRLLKVLLGVSPPEAIAAAFGPEATPTFSLSERAVSQDESYEIVVEAAEDGRLSSTLRIERQDGNGGFVPQQVVTIAVDAQGARRLSLRGPTLPPGAYRFQLLEGESVVDEEELVVMAKNAD